MSFTDRLQRPLQDLRISIIDKCNFRCPYCMPADIFGENYQFLPKSQTLSRAEIRRLAQLFVDLGVTKLRLTGGEPLLHPDVVAIVQDLAALPNVTDLALTTNGSLLPMRAVALKKAGLHRLTISLDSLDEAVYAQMSGQKATVAQLFAGIEAAVQAGFTDLKINCVVQRGVNDHTFVELADYFRGTPHIIRFIEYMDVGNLNGWQLKDVVPAAEILEKIHQQVAPLEPSLPNYTGEVANRYRYVDGRGEIGIIAAVTQPFCSSCTRARLSSAGEYFTCLFAHVGRDLRTPLRAGATDTELKELIQGVWQQRADRYSEKRTSFTQLPRKGAEMYRLGG